MADTSIRRELAVLCRMEHDDEREFHLLYRATRDGFSAAEFHSRCDLMAPTFTVIRTQNGGPKGRFIFGAYVEAHWTSRAEDRETDNRTRDPNSFLFTLRNASHRPLLLPIRQGPHESVRSSCNSGPVFGSGPDIFIVNDSNVKRNCYSRLGHSYVLPDDESHVYSFLAGVRHFRTSEIEVYHVI